MNKHGMLSIILITVLFSCCITGNEETTPHTTIVPATSFPVPIATYTLSIYDYQLQEKITKTEAEHETALTVWQESLEAFRILLEIQNPNYEEIYLAYLDYEAALRDYERVLQEYYCTKILAEHTISNENGFLEITTQTVPFGRPDGNTYTFGELNIGVENYNYLTDRLIKPRILEGINGHDTRSEIIDSLETLEGFLLEYHDVIIGYVYEDMSKDMYCKLLASFEDTASDCDQHTI